jgi:hypothetical protein
MTEPNPYLVSGDTSTNDPLIPISWSSTKPGVYAANAAREVGGGRVSNFGAPGANRYLTSNPQLPSYMNDLQRDAQGNIVSLNAAKTSEVKAQIDAMLVNDPDEYNRLNDILGDTRFGKNNWNTFLHYAQYAQKPWDELLVEQAAYDQANGLGSGGGGGGGPFSSRNTTYSFSTEQQARAYIDEAFASEFGRTATDDEARVFQRMLKKAQKKNPAITETSGYSSGGSSNSTTKQIAAAFDPQQYAMEYVKSQPGWAERSVAMEFVKGIDQFLSQRKDSVETYLQEMGG